MKVMKIRLSPEEKTALEVRHGKERDGRVRDRIKGVLLSAEGWSMAQISQALRIHLETVRTHLQEYEQSQKLKPENGGSIGKLDVVQEKALIDHLKGRTYLRVRDICAYVQEKYGISYTVGGMTSWLHAHNFSYKKPAPTPAKADPEQQETFIQFYHHLLNTTPDDEPILFGDGVHPTMATKVTHGWIRKGMRKPIATTASRTRMNLMGALDLETMRLSVKSMETLNSTTMATFFDDLKERYPKAPKIHLILDRGPYNVSAQTQKYAKERGIHLHYLPPYSPNLNPIERCWKIMNEHVRNNQFFASAKEFRESIMHFFNHTWDTISIDLVQRVNNHFQRISTASSV
jgi:transposase